MKKMLKLFGKIIMGLVVLILAAMILIPVLFKKQIKEVIVGQINGMVNAKVEVADYSLGFFKNFPNLSFSLNEVTVSGTGAFEGDTLADISSFSVVFNLGSLFSDNGYEVKSIIIDRPVINAIVLADESANWDIMKPDTDTVPVPEEGSSSGTMRLLLRQFSIVDGYVKYNDAVSNISAALRNINFQLAGDMTETETDLDMEINVEGVDVIYDGIRYLNGAVVDSKIGVFADLEKMKFQFRDNFFSINGLVLNFEGEVEMPGDDIRTDIKFSTEKTEFKSLISMIPAVYMTGYESLRADGVFSLDGTLTGIYSEADSTLPDARISLTVKDGLISYPDLPEKISAINMKLNIDFDGSEMDKTIVDLSAFHFELAGNPFDMAMLLKTPMSDPDIKASANGKIDFGSLKNAIPLEDMTVSGILEASLKMAGRMSMIEQERYEDFNAEGSMVLSNFNVEMTEMPPVTINRASLSFNPAYAQLDECSIKVGKNSDFSLNGRLGNYIPYVFSDGIIEGSLAMNSNLIDLDEIMGAMPEDTTTVEDTTALALVVVPANIDFTFKAAVANIVYGTIKPSNVRGNLIVRDGMLRISDSEMDLIGGKISMNALYDTRDTLKPVISADMNMINVLVKEAFNTFNTVQKLSPAAKGIEGAISLVIKFDALLGQDMMPVINTVNGEGTLTSKELQIVDSPTFSKISSVLKLGGNSSNTFKDINVSFLVKEGRVFVKPFDTKMGSVKMNISGDQGFDQTINYYIKTEIPRAELGSAVNDLVDNLSAQASVLGITYKPTDVIKVNLKVGGTVTKPEIAPDFGGAGSDGASAISNLTQQAKEEVKVVVQETINDAKDKARLELEAQAEKVMKEAEEKAQLLKDEAASAADKIKAEAEVQAQNLIKQAEGKNIVAKTAAAKAADVLRKEGDKKAALLISEADAQSQKLLAEAEVKKNEILNKK